MNLFSFLKPKKEVSASSAKERLQIIIASERSAGSSFDLPAMKAEIFAVVAKYCKVSGDAIEVTTSLKDGLEVIDVNVKLTPTQAEETATANPAGSTAAAEAA